MATPFRFKRSAVQDKRPEISDLLLGEIALNTYDGRLFSRRTGTGSTVALLNPWSERLGAAAIYYENNVAIGATNPEGRKLYVDGNVEITGITTFGSDVTFNGTILGTQLLISGISTFQGNVDLDADLDVDGRTELDITNISETLNVVGLSTFASNVDINADLDVDGRTELDITNIAETLNVSGLSTFASNVDINADLDVDGRTELDTTNISETLNVTGISTFASAVDINSDLDVDGRTELDTTNIAETLNVVGITTLASSGGITTTGGDLHVGGDLFVADDLVFDEFTARNGNITGILTVGTTLDADGTLLVTGVSTFNSLVDVNNGIDVVGGANVDQLNVVGVSTYGGAVDINSTLDVDGLAELDDVNVSGAATVGGILDVNGGLQANSAKIEDLTDNRVVIAGVGGELEDDANLTFNGTQLAVGVDLDVDGRTELDTTNIAETLNVVGLSTFANAVDINGNLDVDGHTELDDVNVSGASTFAGNIDANGDLDVDGTTDLDVLNVSETATFSALVDVNNRIDVVGGANIDQLNVVGVSTFNGPVDIDSTIDIDGQAEFDDVNVSGVATISTLEVTQATTLKHADSVKFTTTGIGISVANGVGQTAYIEGPSEIWIDPHPVGVATTSGVVRIRGDLYVDGRNFIVDSDVIELADFVVGIASTVPTNLLLDGAGIGIGSESIRKFIRWHNATDSLKTTENWNLASGKHYEIDGVDVLSSDTLGSGVLFSSLETLGTLRGLNVSGVSTFSSLVDVNADLDVTGHTETDTLRVSGLSTFQSHVHLGDSDELRFGDDNDLKIFHNGSHSIIRDEGTGVLFLQGDADVRLTDVGGNEIYGQFHKDGSVDLYFDNVKKFETTADGIDVTGHTETDTLNVSGLSTYAGAVDINSNLDVDGTTDLDVLNVAETATFSALVDVNNRIDVVGGANIDQVNVSGVSTFTGIGTFGSDLFVAGNLNVIGDLVFDEFTATHANITGVTTIGTELDLNGILDVDGDTQLDDLNVSGVATFSQLVDVNNRIDVVGGANIDQVNVSGVSTFTGIGTFGSDLFVAGNLNVIGDLVYDEVSGRNINITGIATIAELDVNNSADIVGGATIDQLNVTGVSTFGGNVDVNATLDVSGDITGTGDFTLTDTDDGSSAGPELKLYRNSATPADADYLGQIKFAGESDTGVERNYAKITGKILDASNGFEDGIIEIAHIKNGSQNISARFRSDSLQLLNGTNFSVNGNTELDGTLDVDGTATFDDVSVGSALTVTGIGTFSSDLFVAGNLNVIGDIVYDEVTGKNINITGVGTIASLQVSDLTNNRIVISGADGELEDDSNLTYDGTGLFVGTALTVSNAVDFNGTLDVDGDTQLDDLNVAGVATFISLVDVNNRLDVIGGAVIDQINVSGVSTFTGIGTFGSHLFVEGDLNVKGDIVYDEVTGRNINITGISTFHGESNIGFGGTTLTALTHISRVGINSTQPEFTLDVDGVINSSTDVRVNGVSIVVSGTPASLDDVVALAIALG